MDKKISVSEESINDINKSLVQLLDNINTSINTVKKSIDIAEMEGWNDIKFLKFKEEFQQAERFLKEGNNYIEDIIMPEIRRIRLLLEGY